MRVRQRIATGIRFYDEGWVVDLPEPSSWGTAEYFNLGPVLISISGGFSGFLEFEFQVHPEALSWVESSEVLLELSNLIAARTLMDWEGLGLRLEMGPPCMELGNFSRSLLPRPVHFPLGAFALKAPDQLNLPILGRVLLRGQRIYRARLDLALTLKGGFALGNHQQAF